LLQVHYRRQCTDLGVNLLTKASLSRDGRRYQQIQRQLPLARIGETPHIRQLNGSEGWAPIYQLVKTFYYGTHACTHDKDPAQPAISATQKHNTG
jgi:hypothetical protein